MSVSTHAPSEHAHEPRSAMSVLNLRATFVTVGILAALAAVAWWSTVGQARGMSDMVTGIGQVGHRVPNDMSAALFMGMWVTMMVAMMFPTIAPIVLAHRMVVRKRGEGLAPTIAFVAGYLGVWTAIGLVPLVAFLWFRSAAGDASWIPRMGGAVLTVAGAYQFTSWKALCLRACRTPLTFLMTHDWRSGARGSLKAGISHGAYCLGCCWALMAVLVIVGLMNLVWMAAIAIVFLAEKNWRHGIGLTKTVGAALIAIGLAIIVQPELLSSIADGGAVPEDPGMTTGQMSG